jgi:hypothetical protein
MTERDRSHAHGGGVSEAARLAKRLESRLGAQELGRPVELGIGIAERSEPAAGGAGEEASSPLLAREHAVATVAGERFIGTVA